MASDLRGALQFSLQSKKTVFLSHAFFLVAAEHHSLQCVEEWRKGQNLVFILDCALVKQLYIHFQWIFLNGAEGSSSLLLNISPSCL